MSNRTPTDESGIVGTARFSRSESDLSVGLRRGDIAVINRPDLEREAAEQLVASGVLAVVNAAQSSTGRYPNLGPQVLADAGVPLIDSVGDGVLARLRSGDRIRVSAGQVYRDDVLVATGTELDSGMAQASLTEASSGLTTRLDTLAANASDHLRREHAMLMEGARIPKLRTKLRGRPVVVVSDEHGGRKDLAGLKRYISDRDPVLIGAGSGAELLLSAGYQPDVVVGSEEALSGKAVSKAKEVVVTTASGQIANPERFEKHGRDLVRFVAEGEDTDLALLLADEADAAVIVHAGAPPSLVDLLEKQAGVGGASFVVRLRAGARIVDAKAVRHFMSGRIAVWPVLLLLLAGVLAVAAAVSSSPAGTGVLSDLGSDVSNLFDDLRTWIEGLIS